MTRSLTFAHTALALGAFTVVAAARPVERPAAGIALRYRNVVSVGRVRALTVLPGETVTFDLVDRDGGSRYVAKPAAGQLVEIGAGRWSWTAPLEPGLYPIDVNAAGAAVTLQAFVMFPYDRLKGEFLNGYRIGRYPAKPLRGLAAYGPPQGFVEVTPENEDVMVSAHFRLKQLLCKQPGSARAYVVLNERLLVALEYVLEQVNAAGYRATTFHVMSAYRTPAYNRAIGNVQYSQHQWGSAADIFIDENGDGRMDDLNGDGRSDIHDAEALYRVIDAAAARPEGQGLIGGIGKYSSTANHGPFVHVDVRNFKARW